MLVVEKQIKIGKYQTARKEWKVWIENGKLFSVGVCFHVFILQVVHLYAISLVCTGRSSLSPRLL